MDHDEKVKSSDSSILQEIEENFPIPKTFLGDAVPAWQKFDDSLAEKFLRFYATTGRKMDSARACGVTYQCVRNWEMNNELFAEMVEEARETFVNHLEREMYRRGVEGWEEPIVAGKDPEIVTYVTKYSDKLLELLARRHAPDRYGNRMNVEANVTGGVLVVQAPATVESSALEVEDVEDAEVVSSLPPE